jgi:hypothetical protein
MADESCGCKWHAEYGVFVPVGSGIAIGRAAAEAPVEDAFLSCFDAIMARGHKFQGKLGAPKVFAGIPEANGYRQRPLLFAMNRLLTANRIKVERGTRSGRGPGWRDHDPATPQPRPSHHTPPYPHGRGCPTGPGATSRRWSTIWATPAPASRRCSGETRSCATRLPP